MSLAAVPSNFVSPARDLRVFTHPSAARPMVSPPPLPGSDDTVELRPAPGPATLSRPAPPPAPRAWPPPTTPPALDFELGMPGALGGPSFAQPVAPGNNPTVLAALEPVQNSQVRINQSALQSTIQLGLGGSEAAQIQYVDDLSMPRGRLPSPEELSRIGNAFHDASNIPFEFILDGCYARAHLMCESLEQHGINHQKIFVFGKLGAQNGVQDVTWWYHVAPLVFVQDQQSGAVDARVIDPGLSREPMTPEDWVKAINRGPQVAIDLTESSQYFPRSTHGVQSSFEANLQPAADTLHGYARALRKLRPEEHQLPVRSGPFAEGHIRQGDRLVELFPHGLAVRGNPGAPDPSKKGLLERLGAAWKALSGDG